MVLHVSHPNGEEGCRVNGCPETCSIQVATHAESQLNQGYGFLMSASAETRRGEQMILAWTTPFVPFHAHLLYRLYLFGQFRFRFLYNVEIEPDTGIDVEPYCLNRYQTQTPLLDNAKLNPTVNIAGAKTLEDITYGRRMRIGGVFDGLTKWIIAPGGETYAMILDNEDSTLTASIQVHWTLHRNK